MICRYFKMYASRRKIKVIIFLFTLLVILNGANIALNYQSTESSINVQKKACRCPNHEVRGPQGQNIEKQNSSSAPIEMSASASTPTATAQVQRNVYEIRGVLPIQDLGDVCDDETRIVVIVCSLPDHVSFRRSIRGTWAKRSEKKDKYFHQIFVTGLAGNADALLREHAKYNDILVGNFNYSVKFKSMMPLLLGTKWAVENCKSLKFIYFGHDNTVLNDDRLMKRIEEREKEGMFHSPTLMGNLVKSSRVVRQKDSIYYVPVDAYENDVFPSFCTEENGFVFTISLAVDLLRHVQHHPFVPIADVFLGILASKHDWSVREDNLFTRRIFNAKQMCAFRTMVTMHSSHGVLMSTWPQRRNITLRRACLDPDLDAVLPGNVDNSMFFYKVLSYKLNHPHVCYDDEGNKTDIFLVALISTPPQHEAVRDLIRETWCKDKSILGQEIRCLFLIGQATSRTEEINKKLRKEDVKHKDIVQVAFFESFQNLTLKVVLGLKWITENCQHATYFYKGDEDMFVNFNNLVSYLLELRRKGQGKGKFWIGAAVHGSIRFSPNNPKHAHMKKYHVPDDQYFGKYYPPYNSGGGYVFATDTIPDMYQVSFSTALINIDDAYQGFLTKKLGFGPTNHKGFKLWKVKTDPCSLRDENTMVVHGNSKNPETLHALWRNYTNTQVDCP